MTDWATLTIAEWVGILADPTVLIEAGYHSDVVIITVAEDQIQVVAYLLDPARH